MAYAAEGSKSDFPNDSRGKAQRWERELQAAKDSLKDWHKKGAEVVEVYLDAEKGENRAGQTRWNLFWSNVTFQLAMLFGNIPRVDVSRRYADADDDAGRIGAEMQERLLNTDIERDSDTTSTALGYALQDWRLPGLGVVRLRYVADIEAAVQDEATGKEVSPEQVAREDVEVDYVHWKDFLWSPARVWHEVRWLAFAADISREKAVERFGEEVGKQLPVYPPRKAEDKDKPEEPWLRIRVWEIWDKESGRYVCWYCEGYPDILDEKEDPLGLEGFWPCPKPLLANCTTAKLVPRPDYLFAQDQYRTINDLSTRIRLLEDAVKVAGFYDRSAGTDFSNIFNADTGNRLIPVDNWAAFAEKGGIQGRIALVPLNDVVAAIGQLTERRREEVDALYQITGQSDIMRGQATSPGATATEQMAKARFGSVRMQALQDEFARFTSDVQRLKAEIISKHFRPETILQRSNAQYAFGKDEKAKPGTLQAAMQLVKDRFAEYRIVVKPDSVALTDFAALRSERTEVIQAVSQFISAVQPLLAVMPQALPFALELLQSLVAGLRGASTLEGVIDRAIAQAEAAQEAAAANPQPQQEDPKLQAERMKQQTALAKGQADKEKEQVKLQADLVRIQAETQAHAQQEQAQAEWNAREALMKQQVTNALKPPAPPSGYVP